MRKVLTVLLAILVFIGVTMCMSKPAYTDIALIPNAEADTKPNIGPIHKHQYETTVTEATCTEPAVLIYTCACGDAYEEITHELADHKYIVNIVEPTCTENGYSVYTCIHCGYNYTDNPTEKLPHDFKCTIINPTCIQNGYSLYECKNCDESYTSEFTEKSSEHDWTDWDITRNATPTKKGHRVRMCTLCCTTQSEPIPFAWAGEYAVYIPNTKIHAEFVIADFTQSSVDNYDVVYSTPIDTMNPFIIGHNTRTMETLYNVEIGQYIYVKWNNEVRVYEVVISEFALQNETHTDMFGQTTGTSIWDSVGDETLHLYTCYGATKDHRWMVLAKRIQ